MIKHSQSSVTVPHYQSLSIFVPKPQNRLCQKTESLQRVKSNGHIIYLVSQLHPLQQVQVPHWIVVSYARQTSIPFMSVPGSKHKHTTKSSQCQQSVYELFQARPLCQSVQVASQMLQVPKTTPHIIMCQIKGSCSLKHSSYMYSAALNTAPCKSSIVKYSHGLHVESFTNDMPCVR